MIAGRANRLSVSNFRSLKKLSLPLDHVAIYLGENGTGKTNIYRTLELFHRAAIGDLSAWLAKQGGMYSAYWAGAPDRRNEGRITAAIDIGDYRYSLELGFKSPTMAAFPGEPLVKEETLEFVGTGGRKIKVLDRKGPSITVRTTDNKTQRLDLDLLMAQTAISAIPLEMASHEIAALRNTLLDWRFFHAFRVDENSPLRRECDAVTATRLNSDGSNLAAVFATLEHIRQDTVDLKEIVRTAFDGAELIIPEPDKTASFSIRWPDMPQRLFDQRELSDGTLHFLALCGALLSYHTPNLIVLNEPEASLHPEMLPALAKLISVASESAQIIIVTHSERLASELEAICACPVRTVYKHQGETRIQNLSLIGEFTD